MSPQTREIKNVEIVRLCCGDAGRAFIYGIITSFLLVFYIPPEGVDAMHFIPRAALTLGIIKAIGTVWDAITDPLVASISDKYKKSRLGRRIPFMRVACIPYAVFALAVYFLPIQGESFVNAICLALALLLFYTASTVYYIPYSALQVEVVNTPRRRVFFYTINSLMYVLATALVYGVFLVKSILTKAGFSYEWSYRLPFIVYAVLGLILIMIPAFGIRETDFVERGTDCHVPLFESLRKTLSNKNFVIIVLAYLVMWVGLTFFNSTLAYYVTVLLEMDEAVATLVLAISIIVGVISYPFLNKAAARFGKKPLLVFACVMYTVLYTAIYFYEAIITVIPPMVFLIALGVLLAVPISITNIMPMSCIGDIAQYDSIVSGEKRTGMFVAAKNFVGKLSDSIVVILVSLTITIGSLDGQSATVQGVRLTAIIAAVSTLIAVVLYSLYRDKDILHTIETYNASHAEDASGEGAASPEAAAGKDFE